jgi:hypothetical protein
MWNVQYSPKNSGYYIFTTYNQLKKKKTALIYTNLKINVRTMRWLYFQNIQDIIRKKRARRLKRIPGKVTTSLFFIYL